MSITRRNHGRGHSYRIDGEKVPGVTTILGATLPKPALIEWAGKTTAGYAVDYWEDLADLPPSKRLDRLNRARFEDRDAAANRGTEVHALAERHMAGDEVEIPDELEGHFRAYESFLAEWRPVATAVELVVGHRTMGYCGTVDVVADLADNNRWLLDYKTSRSGIFPETALQGCAYRRAEVFLDNDGQEHDMAELGIERVGGLHLRADGTFDLYPLATDDDVWAYFRHLAWLYRQQDAMAEWVGTAARAPRTVDA
jgi:hypothetical protein